MSHWSTAGLLAKYDGDCARCDRPFRKGVDHVVRRSAGHWIHASCASGADE